MVVVRYPVKLSFLQSSSLLCAHKLSKVILESDLFLKDILSSLFSLLLY